MRSLNRPARVTLALGLTLTACAPTLPITKTDPLPMPHEFPLSESKDADASTAALPWAAFAHDPHLVSLIETALKGNQELHIVEQEINIANNEVMARRSEYLPKLDARVGGGVEQTERFSTDDANGRTIVGKAGLGASWEVDIWGRLRKAKKAAYLRYLGSVEGRRFAVTNLVSEVAQTYFELLSFDNQLAIVENYVAVLTKIREMVTLQRDAARATTLAVKRFEAEVLKNEARRADLSRQVTVTENRLNQLLGRYPQPIERDRATFERLSFVKLQTSVATKLLDNRPDLKKAKFELEAAKLNVDSARARFYPSLSIEGGVGYEHFKSSHFDKPPTSLFYDAMAGLTAPLLNRLAIKADYFTANNKQIQAVYEYEQTLIKAYTEVANQLTSLKNLDQMYGLKTKQVKALTDAIEISNILFRAARVDYVEALFTQRDALETETELMEIRQRQLTATVNLYRALGGGWREGEVAAKR